MAHPPERMRGAISASVLAMAAVMAAGVGVGVGLWNGVLESADTDEPVRVLERVSTARCPEGSPTGVLHGGDRVFATGRDEQGDWLEIRDPGGPSQRVWVESRYVEPDNDTDDLEVASCDPRGDLSLAQGSTTTAPPDDGDDDDGDDDDDGPGDGGGDTTGPAITGVARTPTQIWERNFAGDPGSCNMDSNLPVRSTVSAQVGDPSGVANVTMSWSVAATSESKPMAGSGTYSAFLGPFPDTTISSGSAPIAVTITARDGAGNTSTASASVVLNDCGFG